MARVIYNSPSNHGVGQNKCRKANCYEDKHTKPIALKADKLFEKCGFKSIVADDDAGILNGERTAEANKAGADLYIAYHTNAFSNKNTRYLLFMCYRTDGEYRKLFNCVKKYMEKIYDGDIIFKAVDDLVEITDPNAMTFYCEFGFHTNKKDCDEFIHNPDAIAEALVHGVCDYYGVKFKGGESTEKEDEKKPAPKPTPKPLEEKVVEEDGLWGVDTTKATQKLLGSYRDGVVSNQLYSCKKFLPNMLDSSWEFSYIARGGSPMIEKLQTLIGSKVDGYAGKGTMKDLQLFLRKKGLYNGKIDGIGGSGTVTGWQKYLNKRLA